MSYYNIHYGKVIERLILPKYRFEKGMVAQISYKSQKTERIKDYMAIILNPRYKGKMHLLSLENVSYEQINDFAELTGLKRVTTIKNVKKFDISKLIMDTSSYRFYNKEVKYFLNHHGVDSYKTFFLNRFKNNFIVDYKFSNKILKKYGFEK